MGYFRNALDHAKYMAPFVYRDQQEPSWADSLRLAKDTFHNAAVLAVGMAIGVELAGDGPFAHAWAIGLGGLALMGEMGSHINDRDLQRELASNQILAA